MQLIIVTASNVGGELVSATHPGQQRAPGCGHWALSLSMRSREKAAPWGTLEGSWGAVQASEAPGGLPHQCCLCQFEGMNLIILSGFLLPLDLRMPEEKGRTYKFHCRSKSPSFPHFGELMFLYMEYLGFLQALCSQGGTWLEVPYSHFHPQSIPQSQIPKTTKKAAGMCGHWKPFLV